jgi:class 3 adenylate cyclase
MGKTNLEEHHSTMKTTDGKTIKLLTMKGDVFNSFNPDVLDLGDIGAPSIRIEGLAAIFDLAGFTNFSSQVDPHLTVPEFLSRWLNWLFDEIREESLRESSNGDKILWSSLPFLAKFLGDGILFLWDTKNMGGAEVCNVVTSLHGICASYISDFYPLIRRIVTQPPSILRCGISRGMVISIGNGEDYVGPCINIASRLQKLSSLTFCVSRRGFDLEKYMPEETAVKYALKSVALRGIGEDELVWVRKEEFEELSAEEKKLFKSL